MTSSAYWSTVAVLFLAVFFSPSPKAKARPQRLGRDPGLFSLRTWLARIDFLFNGPKLIEQSYQKVLRP